MLEYMILVDVHSTVPQLNTDKKVRCLGIMKAKNSHEACLAVSKKLNVPYDKMHALVVKQGKNGNLLFETYNLKN
tara:strand:+ start:247 stop:471 length:225 start_codon:yes stop_codon:yes gene_type:complete